MGLLEVTRRFALAGAVALMPPAENATTLWEARRKRARPGAFERMAL
jgi:hypothetical protein